MTIVNRVTSYGGSSFMNKPTYPYPQIPMVFDSLAYPQKRWSTNYLVGITKTGIQHDTTKRNFTSELLWTAMNHNQPCALVHTTFRPWNRSLLRSSTTWSLIPSGCGFTSTWGWTGGGWTLPCQADFASQACTREKRENGGRCDTHILGHWGSARRTCDGKNNHTTICFNMSCFVW